MRDESAISTLEVEIGNLLVSNAELTALAAYEGDDPSIQLTRELVATKVNLLIG